MRKWWALSLVLVCIVAVVVWQMLPPTTARAQNIALPLPLDVTITILSTYGPHSVAIPGVRELLFKKFEIKENGEFREFRGRAKHWDLCYIKAGQLIWQPRDGKAVSHGAEEFFVISPDVKANLRAGSSGMMARCWDLEVE